MAVLVIKNMYDGINGMSWVTKMPLLCYSQSWDGTHRQVSAVWSWFDSASVGMSEKAAGFVFNLKTLSSDGYAISFASGFVEITTSLVLCPDMCHLHFQILLWKVRGCIQKQLMAFWRLGFGTMKYYSPTIKKKLQPTQTKHFSVI